MILYYSASGNCGYIAALLAKKLEDECIDLRERIKKQDYDKVVSKKPFVVVSPVYGGEMPVFLREYLKRLPFRGSREIYFVFSCSGNAGLAGALAERLARRKDMFCMGREVIEMPNDRVTGNTYRETSPEECRRLIKNAAEETERIADLIGEGGKLGSGQSGMFERLAADRIGALHLKHLLSSKEFHATDKCLACGKCCTVCPVNNIRIETGKPVWESPCARCIACMLSCPREAIEFGEITAGKEKYHIRKYLDEDNQ